MKTESPKPADPRPMYLGIPIDYVETFEGIADDREYLLPINHGCRWSLVLVKDTPPLEQHEKPA